MAFLSDPRLAPVAGFSHLWRLTDPLVYRDAEVGTLSVQPGAVTDGASIPRLLWTLLGPPMRDSRVLRAAAIHDQLYRSLGIGGHLQRAACDEIFRCALLAAGVPAHKAWLYWAGVRLGGWLGWSLYGRNPEKARAEARLIDWQLPPDHATH